MRNVLLIVIFSLLGTGCSDPSGGGDMILSHHAGGSVESRGYQKGVNVRTGEWEFFFENGVLEEKGTYVDGEKSGEWTMWDEDGKKRFKGTFLHGKLHGKTTSWTSLGAIREICEWDNGKRHGKYRRYWLDSEKIKREGFFQNDVTSGIWTTWHKNGQMKIHGEIGADQEPQGPFSCWREDGTLDHEVSGVYEAGQKIAELPVE